MRAEDVLAGFRPEGLVTLAFSAKDGGTAKNPLVIFLRKTVLGKPINYIKVRHSDIKRNVPDFAYPEPEDIDYIKWQLDDNVRLVQRRPAITLYDRIAKLPVVFRFITGAGDKDFRVTFEAAALMSKILQRVAEDGYLIRPMEDTPIQKAKIVDPKEATIDLSKYAQQADRVAAAQPPAASPIIIARR